MERLRERLADPRDPSETGAVTWRSSAISVAHEGWWRDMRGRVSDWLAEESANASG
jgi:hypothetical protein